MPGTVVHIGTAPPDVRASLLGIKGLIAPDYWKKQIPTEEEYKHFFEGCPGAPSYKQVLLLCSLDHGGTHFGPKPQVTSRANVGRIEKLFKENGLDENNIFFKGFVHHLMVDKLFYSNPMLFDMKNFRKDRIADSENTMITLHCDWDKLNVSILGWYPEIEVIIGALPERFRNEIKFKDSIPRYVYLGHLKQFMDEMRKPRTIKELLHLQIM